MNGSGRTWTFSRATKPRGPRRPLGKMFPRPTSHQRKSRPCRRISAAVRAEDRRKAEKVRASAVFSALGDGAWASQTKEVAMAVEEEVVVKAEEAPVRFKGSVRFEIKNQGRLLRGRLWTPFRRLRIAWKRRPPRAPVARPKPAAPVEVVEPPVIDCAGGVSASHTIPTIGSTPSTPGLRPAPSRDGVLRESTRLDAIDAIPRATQRRRRQRLGGRRGPGRGAPPPRDDVSICSMHRRVTRRPV